MTEEALYVIETHETERFDIAWLNNKHLVVRYLTSQGWYIHETFDGDQFEEARRCMNRIAASELNVHINCVGEVSWWPKI